MNLEAVGTPIASLPNGVGALVSTDPVPFEHTADMNTYQVTAAELLGLAAVKPAVNAISNENLETLGGMATVDAVELTPGQLVLLTAQATARQNGPWVIQSGAWTRPAWYYSDATGGSSYTNYTSVSQAYAGVTMQAVGGSIYSGTTWQLTTIGEIAIDSTSTSWIMVQRSTGPVSAPAGNSTDIQYNDDGFLAGTDNFTFTNTTNTLTIGGNSGADGIVTAGAPGPTSSGYRMWLRGGPGGATSGDGGDALLAGGTPNQGAGGSITVSGANGVNGGDGGAAYVHGGNGDPIGNGGGILILSGSGGAEGGTSGNIDIAVGYNSFDDGGSITLAAGNVLVGPGSGAGGRVNIAAGAAYSAAGLAGSVLISPGVGSDETAYTRDGTTQIKTAQGNAALTIDIHGNSVIAPGASHAIANRGGLVDQGYYLPTSAPVDGGIFTIPPNTGSAVFNPAGPLSAQIFAFPPTPIDGQLLEVSFTEAVVSITWPNNVSGGPIAIAANTGLGWRFVAPLSRWIRRF